LPFLQLADRLRGRGEDVTLVTHHVFEDRVRGSGCSFAPLDTPAEYERLLEWLPGLHRPQDWLRFCASQMEGAFDQEVRLLRGLCGSGDATLITHHNSLVTARTAAEALGVPTVCLFLAPSFLMSLPFLAEACSTLGATLNGHRAAAGLGPVQDWHQWLRSTEGNVACWPDWFCPCDPEWESAIDQVGFVTNGAVEDPGLPEQVSGLLAGGGDPVLITHATSRAHEDRFFAAAIAGVHAVGRDCLVVTPHLDLLPSGLPPRVIAVPYLPFSRVMPYVSAVVHHGGVGTLAQAMLAGVPQLVLPTGFDRPENAARLQDLGVGEALPPPLWSADGVAAALNRLLEDPAVRRRCWDLSARLKTSSDAVEGVCNVIQRVRGVRVQPLSETPALARLEEGREDDAPTVGSQRSNDVYASAERRSLLARRLLAEGRRAGAEQRIPRLPRSS
jgi:UDP:flavonoid glycosyltransferase YjiC (YdhE family)